MVIHTRDHFSSAQAKVASALAGQGITVQFRAGTTPMADVKRKLIILPPIDDNIIMDVDGKAAKLYRCWLDHESAHISFTDPKVAINYLMNAIEDGRINKLQAERFPGSRISLEFGTENAINQYRRNEHLNSSNPMLGIAIALCECAYGADPKYVVNLMNDTDRPAGNRSTRLLKRAWQRK